MITSKDNPRVRRWAKLVRDARFRRSERRAVVEGPHLVALATPVVVFGTREAPVLLSESVFRSIVDVPTPQGIAAEIEIPDPGPVRAPAVVLEGVQDPGNVGTILRSAAAFGVRSAVLDQGCADPWSPKVLRAGMGAHFALGIHQEKTLQAVLKSFPGRVLCALPRDGTELAKADLSGAIGWLFGAEGQGVSDALRATAAELVTIPMAPGTESINVAAAAAICLQAAYKGPPAKTTA